MWSFAKSTSRGGFSVRSIFTHALIALVAIFFLTLIAVPPSNAADGTWSSDSTISYDGHDYLGPAAADLVENLGLPKGAQVYTFVDPAQNPTTNGSSSSNSPPATDGPRQIHVIYFASDTDIKTAVQAKYRTYTYEGRTSFKDPSNPKDITLQAQSGTASAGTSSCNVEGGVGWWICPITNFLAGGMDWIYDILSGFLTVQPPQTGQDNALFRAWSYMRSFANVAFVIVFLIIIYSQISNIGISNYSLKKLFPRLIIAALLVNLSYIICSVAIDISNVLGYSLQDIFVNMRNSLVGTEGNGFEVTSWQSITGFILSGGTAATAGGIALFTTLTTYGIGGSLFLLLPALVTGLVAVLVALVIMAARQAIIIVLVIISPLAFVAYLLPNTEKWFERWRGTMMTMLILFPAFSIIFGGSQLAATAIIQNADSINLIILGMMVQVAPLFVTPILVRLSGSLLGKIAGLTNNPQKGLIDRTRNFTKDRTDNLKDRRLRDGAGKRNVLRQGAIWRDNRRRNREGLAGAAKAEADGRWAQDRRFTTSDQRMRAANDYKSYGEALSGRRYDASKIVQEGQTKLTRTQRIGADLYNAQKEMDEAKHLVEMQYSNMQAAESASNRIPVALGAHAARAQQNYQLSQAIKTGMSNTEGILQAEYAKTIGEASGAGLLKVAAGIDPHGGRHALANAKALIDEQMNKAIKEIESTSGIKAGDVMSLSAALERAVADNDMASIVAFTNKLGNSQNNGIVELRKQLMKHEENVGQPGGLSRKDLDEWKLYIDANATINTAAEDIGSWSREQSPQTLRQRWSSGDTWKDMTLEAWSRQKKSSQFASMKAGFINLDKAKLLLGDELRPSLKQSVIKELEKVVSSGGVYRPQISDKKVFELNNPNYYDEFGNNEEDMD